MGNNPPVADQNADRLAERLDVRRDVRQLAWLQDRDIVRQGSLLNARCNQLLTTPPARVWLGHDEAHSKAGCEQLVERNVAKILSPKEYDWL